MSNNLAMSTPPITPHVLVRAEDTAGAAGVVENRAVALWDGPPLHHHDFDEAFHVLEGEVTFQLGDEVFTAGAGQHVFVPRGAIHTLANLSGAPARYLLTVTPGGFERYFDRMAAEIEGREPPATAAGDYPETIVVGPQLRARLGDLSRRSVKTLP